jgi:hypothetical protein
MALGAFSEESQVDRIFPPEHGTSHELVRQNSQAHNTFPCDSPTPAGRSAILLAFFYLAEHGGLCVRKITARPDNSGWPRWCGAALARASSIVQTSFFAARTRCPGNRTLGEKEDRSSRKCPLFLAGEAGGGDADGAWRACRAHAPRRRRRVFAPITD